MGWRMILKQLNIFDLFPTSELLQRAPILLKVCIMEVLQFGATKNEQNYEPLFIVAFCYDTNYKTSGLSKSKIKAEAVTEIRFTI